MCRVLFKRFVPDTIGVGFIIQGLISEDFFWLFPPVNLLCRAVEYPVLFRSGGVYYCCMAKSSFSVISSQRADICQSGFLQ